MASVNVADGTRQDASSRAPALVLACFLACLVLASGCGRRLDKWERLRPPVYPAGGTVLIDDLPQPGVLVIFESTDKKISASGLTDGGGRFVLQTFVPGDGAIGGAHDVRIEKWVTRDPQAAHPVQDNVLPKLYASPDKSGLKATVEPRGRNQFEFRLTMKESRR